MVIPQSSPGARAPSPPPGQDQVTIVSVQIHVHTASHQRRSLIRAIAGKVRFVAEAKDLESDEAIWALYERWCVAFSQERSREEMARRFGMFKETALMVDETNRADLPYKLEINDSADGKVRELRAMKVPLSSPGVDRRWMRHSSRSAVYYGRPISHEPAEEEVHPSSTE
jgi:hypothetical protein